MKELATPLYKLNIEEKSNIIETPLAWHVLILQSIQSEYQLSLSEVKDNIEKTIMNLETDNYYNNTIEEISEKILNGENINDISKIYNFKIESIKKLDRNNESKENLIKKLIEISFNSNKDFLSNVTSVNENLSFILNVEEIYLSKPINFEVVKDKVLKDWSKIKKIEKIEKDIKININNKDYLLDLAKKYNVLVEEATVSKTNKNLPTNVINSIFSLEKNQNTINVFNDIFYVTTINEVILPGKDNNQNDTINMEADFKSSFGQQLMTEKKISINENLVSAIIEQY